MVSGNILPYDTTTIKFGFNSFNVVITSSLFLIFSGWNTGILFSSAKTLTGGFVSFIPLPAGLSGWQKTPTTLYLFSTNSSNDFLANSGVPINTILKSCFFIYTSNYYFLFLCVFFLLLALLASFLLSSFAFAISSGVAVYKS